MGSHASALRHGVRRSRSSWASFVYSRWRGEGSQQSWTTLRSIIIPQCVQQATEAANLPLSSVSQMPPARRHSPQIAWAWCLSPLGASTFTHAPPRR